MTGFFKVYIGRQTHPGSAPIETVARLVARAQQRGQVNWHVKACDPEGVRTRELTDQEGEALLSRVTEELS
jgi:hypothetical protein